MEPHGSTVTLCDPRQPGAQTPQERSPRRAHKSLALAALIVWAMLVFVVIGTLMVGHWYTLPTPDAGIRPDVARAIAGLRPASSRGWMAVHVLFGECRCSQRIFEHLFSSRRPTDLDEHILLVGQDMGYTERARQRGFTVTRVAPSDLHGRFHVEAAPLLLVSAPNGSLQYAGGYTERKQGLAIRDLAIVDGLRAQEPVSELPAFGCAVSRSLQDLLDPLGVKYRK